MGDIEVIEGDAVKKLKEFEDESVDLVITDPPYNLGKEFGEKSELKDFEEYIEFTKNWTKECKRILKHSGTIYSFMGFRFISYLYQILEDDLGLNFNNWIVWHYTQGMGRRKGFSPRHDDILIFTKSNDFNFYLDNIRIPQKYYRERNNMRGANPGDVWGFSHVHYCQGNRQKHPTQKPEGLIERLVLASSKEGDIVLDPFSGSGTTLRVCQQLERECYGIEKNHEYVEMTKERLKEPFDSFSGVDPRIKRIPNDLNDEEVRIDYLLNHIKWFLEHHENELDDFFSRVKEKYNVETVRTLKDRLNEKTSRLAFK